MNSERGFSMPVVLLILGLISMAAFAMVQNALLASTYSEAVSAGLKDKLIQERAFNMAVDRMRFNMTGMPSQCAGGVCGLTAPSNRYWTPEGVWDYAIEPVAGSGFRQLIEHVGDVSGKRRFRMFLVWKSGVKVLGFQSLVLVDAMDRTTILTRTRYG